MGRPWFLSPACVLLSGNISPLYRELQVAPFSRLPPLLWSSPDYYTPSRALSEPCQHHAPLSPNGGMVFAVRDLAAPTDAHRPSVVNGCGP